MALPPSPNRAPISAAVGPASVQREDGKRAKGKLHSVSLTGGTLRLAKALGEGDFVEVAFQTLAGKVAGLAEMLNPVEKTQDSVLQPFRFVAMAEDDHAALRMSVDSVDRNPLKTPHLKSRKHL